MEDPYKRTRIITGLVVLLVLIILVIWTFTHLQAQFFIPDNL
jgi:hypothetical protein